MEPNLFVSGDLHGVLSLPPSIIGWEVEAVQREKGRLFSEVRLFQGKRMHLAEIQTSKSLMYKGCGPEEWRSFLVRIATHGPHIAHGLSIDDHELFISPTSHEVDVITPTNSHAFNLSFPKEELDNLIRKHGSETFFKQLRLGGCFRPSPESLQRLCGVLVQATSVAESSKEPQRLRSMCEDVVHAFGQCLSTTSSSIRQMSPNARRRIVRRVIDFIRSRPHENCKLAELCKAAEVSERSLLYAFKLELGMTPKAYLKIYRLHGVFRELRSGNCSSITEAATRWGFWHMGQFGVDYKEMFGELPSETLRAKSPTVHLMKTTPPAT
tara:strand:+ start:1235 stop:2209 length:975 start_codon:yes stop_codon:yes gene_type:complete